MLRRNSFALLLCISIMATAAPAAAQSVPPRPVPLGGDTSAWRPLLQYVVETLAAYIGRAATDTIPQPWAITLPDTTGRWSSVAAHFRTMLRARAPTPADSTYFELRVGALRVRGDTAMIHLNWSFHRKCADGKFRAGYGNYTEPFVVRMMRSGFHMWTAVQGRSVLHGDSSCG